MTTLTLLKNWWEFGQSFDCHLRLGVFVSCHLGKEITMKKTAQLDDE